MELNAFEALRDATRESALVSVKLKELIQSGNRHGDLQVARSAALRVIESLDRMIAYEQGELLAEHEDDPEPPAPRRSPKPAPRPTRAEAKPDATSVPAAGELGTNGRLPSGTQAALIKLIEKAPGKHTSGDLAHLTGLNVQSVYVALAVMKKAGRVYTQPDNDGDGRRKWHFNEGSI